MTPDTAPSTSKAGRLTAEEARQRLDHERESRLMQLKAIEEAEQQASDDLLSAQKAATKHILSEIDAAIGRLDNGVYGICQDCAKPIPAERLEILPYTRHCVGCRRQSA
ncbi:TraR/DksA C4-type zinc finger protein [Streptomyces sp. NPDC003077]|uniref:TraR/DksA family transcriptional regulator n=1 Tax=Streptomyces sp. NPDC003077 TaxID=3154443 RepID=UPI0033A7F9DC